MEKKTARLEAFSDGIFGVAITLLAIEIGIKEYEGATNANLWIKIKQNWPEYFTYFNSFATVLLIWMGHNKIIDHLRKFNHWIILLNGLLLMFIVLFPYPTKLVGSFIGTAAQDTAIGVYASFTGCITFSMFILGWYISRNPKLMVSPEKGLAWFKISMRGQVIGFIVYQIAAILALFHYSYIALGITFFMWIFWAILSKDDKEEGEEEAV